MNGFIEVTDVNDRKVLLNTRHIIHVSDSWKGKRFCEILLLRGEIDLKHSVQQIKKMICNQQNIEV